MRRFALIGLTLGACFLTTMPAPAQTTEGDRLFQEATAPHTIIPTARQKFEQALRNYQQTNDRPGIEKTSIALAEIAYGDGDYIMLNRLIITLNNPQDETLQTKLQGLKGFLSLEQEQYRPAEAYLIQADHRSAANPQLNNRYRLGIAQVQRYQGQYRQALSRFQGILGASIEPLRQADALQGMADVHLDLGQYSEAITFYQRTLKMRETLGNLSGNRNLQEQLRAQTHLGRAYQALGRTSEARSMLQNALDRIFSDQRQRLGLLNQIAQLDIESNNLPAALKGLQTAEQMINRNGQYPQSHTENLIIFGNYYSKSGDKTRAESYYQKAIDRAAATKDIVNQTRALTELGKLRLKANPQGAIKPLLTSIALYEAQRPGLRDSQKISIGDRQALTYQILQRAYIQLGNPSEALVIAERGRARAFVDLLQRQDASTQTTPTFTDIQAVARQHRATLVTYSLLQDPDRPHVPLEAETDLYIWVVSPEGKVTFRAVDLRAKSLAQIAAKTRSAAQDGDIQGPVTSIAQSLRREVTRAGIQITRVDGHTQGTQTTGEAIRQGYDLLIEPIQDLLPPTPDERVVIIPQGPLFLVPFHALQDKQSKFFIENHSLQIAPSIQTLGLTKTSTQATGKPLVVGNPSPMPEGFSALPGSEIEAKAVAQLLNTEALLGGQATKQRVLDQIRNASVLHFATHGLLDDLQGMQSAIALVGDPKPRAPGISDPSLLTAEELTNLHLNARLAVLSACNTGRGKITGDGVVGLSRSLLSSGVPTVVVSLWEVPDGETQRLMTSFYTQLQKQPDKAKAMRGAMLESMQRSRSPNNWAGFILIGSAD